MKAALPDSAKAELERLYLKKGYSVRMLAEHFNVSIDSAYYAMRRFGIKRRSGQEASAAVFAMKPVSFHPKEKLSRAEESLKAVGIALYWGEGYKTEKSKGVDFANSDAGMIRVFLRFLRTICVVDEGRFRVLLYCHDKKKIPEYLKYWSAITEIPKAQFSKPYVAKRLSIKGTGMPYGLIHVRYSDKKLLDLIRSWIREYADC